MKRISLQWRLTCIITVYIAVICGCLTMFVYKNGVYYIDSLQETVDAQGEDNGDDTDEIYISIPDDKWDEFANDFSIQAYNNKEDYKKNSLLISAILALIGGVGTYFISGHALRPNSEFRIIRCLNVSRTHLRYRGNLPQMQHMNCGRHYL